MDQRWKPQTVPGSIKPVYGARYPPIATAPTQLPTSPTKDRPNGASKDTDDFRSFQAGVEDAWDLADEKALIQSTAAAATAAQVLASHRGGKAALPHPAHAQLNLAQTPSKHSKVRAMQLLAMQKKPLPGSAVKVNEGLGYLGPGDDSPAVPGTSAGLYPKLPLINPDHSSSAAAQPGRAAEGQGASSLRDLNRQASSGSVGEKEVTRYERLTALLSGDSGAVNLEALRKECWKGIPHKHRPLAWKLLLGYMPLSAGPQRTQVIGRKRAEYWDYVSQYFHTRYEEHNSDTFRQIHIDIPRMCPLIPLFQQKRVQEIFERILYIWAIRHPACGYVQGINDLVTPFFVVFLSAQLSDEVEVSTFLVDGLDGDALADVEADSFWSVSALLDTIQDNYTFAQPGIQHKIGQLSHLMSRVDPRAARAVGEGRGGVSAVRLPLDEQSPHARASAGCHHPPLGHLPLGERRERTGLRRLPRLRLRRFPPHLVQAAPRPARLPGPHAPPPEPPHCRLARARDLRAHRRRLLTHVPLLRIQAAPLLTALCLATTPTPTTPFSHVEVRGCDDSYR